MPYFDYGYFKYSNASLKKNNPKKERLNLSKKRGIINRIKANQFSKEFYDGNRLNGYGGFNYDGRWKIFLKKIIEKYKLDKNSKVLDIGCKKGFFMKDLKDMIPGIKIHGIEDHKYPIKNSMNEVKSKIKYIETFTKINFRKNEFDFVHAHNSIYIYNLRDMIKIIKIIKDISKKSHITIPAYINDLERLKFLKWTLTGTTILHQKEWKKMFKYLGYKGDYYFSGAKSFGL